MYQQYFGFSDTPFSIAPNPQFLYMSPRHQEALAHLLYGVQSDGGFILLTGEVGTGKTTLCRCLLEQIPEDVETAFVLNPRVTAKQLLASICDEFGIAYPQTASLKRLVDSLNSYLLECHAAHRRAVLIIDEAQNLSRDLLEQLRLLTNLETSERKLLQIILLGQPELQEMLAGRDLRQFSQRITARFHLEALGRKDTLAYIRHRLQVVGGDENLVTVAAMSTVYRLTGGIPRLINLICDRALLGAYAQDEHRVTSRTVKRAAREVLGPGHHGPGWAQVAAGIAALGVMVTAAFYLVAPAGHEAGEAATHGTPLPREKAVIQQQAPLPEIVGHRRLSSAYHDLFALWGTAFEDRSEEPCVLADAVGLRCYDLAAGLSEIARINRPVIVSLADQFLTVARITDDRVTLIAGTYQVDLTPAQFNTLYNGRASMLWRAPPAYTTPLKVSDSGEAVDYLVTQLSRIEGETPPATTGFIYNESLAARVRNFQASVGLTPSGFPDPLTWVHINNLHDGDVPKLQEHQG